MVKESLISHKEEGKIELVRGLREDWFNTFQLLFLFRKIYGIIIKYIYNNIYIFSFFYSFPQ